MNEPLENLYFNWLCAKVIRLENPTPSLTYWKLLRELHNTEFVWLLTGDDNRAEDGLELRYEFVLEADIPDDPIWRSIGCSVLEMLIAFSRRTEFMTSEPAAFWFWEFISNLGLKRMNDVNASSDRIASTLYKFVWRQYNFNGRGGGLFPLRRPQHDQREVEIWYQFSEWIYEKECA
jgi:hypothetical protein